MVLKDKEGMELDCAGHHCCQKLGQPVQALSRETIGRWPSVNTKMRDSVFFRIIALLSIYQVCHVFTYFESEKS